MPVKQHKDHTWLIRDMLQKTINYINTHTKGSQVDLLAEDGDCKGD